MSADLEDLLRAAAGGPAPPLDVATLRRRGRRRRWGTRVLEAGGLAVAAALVLTVLPDVGPAAPVVDSEPPAPLSSPDDGRGPRLAIHRHDDRCVLRFRERGTVRAEGNLDDDRAAVLCASSATTEQVRAMAPIYSVIGRAPGQRSGVHRVVGIVDDEVAEVVLIIEEGPVVAVATTPVVTPGDVRVRAFVAEVPPGAPVAELEALAPDGRRIYVRVPDDTADRPAWELVAAEEPTITPEPDDDGASAGRPFDDVAYELPAVVDPLGTWRPERSPVDLSPFSLRDTADQWYANDAPGEPAYPVDRQVVVDRLGSAARFEELCAFLHAQFARATAEVDVAEEEPSVVAATVVHLVLRQEEVVAGDAVTATIGHVCGLPSSFGG